MNKKTTEPVGRNINNNEHCRNHQAEIDRDVAHRLDQEQGLADTPEQLVNDRVMELMDADSQDEDSMVVLMESEYFRHALRRIMHEPHYKNGISETAAFRLANLSNNLIGIAESVLSEYVEGKS
jgi:hypothetical protein